MDRLESLYGALSAKYDLGSFDEFKTKLEDPEKRKALYEFASNDFELGDFDSFSLKIEDSFKKKEDGESLSQEDTSVGDDLMGFYEKSSADAFKDYRKKTIDKYSEVIKKDPAFAAIADNINANLKRRYNRLVDSYLYNPSFDRNNPEAIAQANREIEQQFKEMRKNAFNENEEYKALLDKYDTELKDVITSEYQARLKDEGRAIADVQKEAALKSMSSTIHPFMGILSSAAKGEGIISAFGDAIVYKIPQAFQAYNLADDSQRYNKLSDSLKELEDMDANQPVYLSEKGNYMKVTQKEGVDIPSQTNFGTLMTAAEAVDVVRDMSDIKLKEISPKLESALELNEFVNRISQTKGLTEDMSFGNIMRNIAEQVPNMAVAAVAPVIGTTILEAGNTYVEQIIEIARQEKGEDYTTQDVLDIIERGDDGAALSQSSGVISGGLDVIGLAGITSVIMTPVKSLGKQILKQGVKEGIKKIGKTKAAEIGLGIAKSGFWEGVTEGLQGANMQFSKIETVERATGTRLEFDWKPVMEEALMGGIMGGVFGGVGTTFNVVTDTNATGLPEDDITLAAVSQEKSYFNGGDAITRAEADTAIQQAENLDQLERIKVTNDEPLIAKFLEKQKELDDGKPSYTDDGRTINRKFAGKKIVLAQNVAEVERINIRNDEELQAEKEKKIEALKAKEAKAKEVAPEETRKSTLKQLMEATGDDVFISGVADGTFAGEGMLNMDSNGNVVLTRFTDEKENLIKSGQITENLSEISGQFGGEQIATSGVPGGLQALSNKIVGEYRIPVNDMVQLIKDGYIVFAGLGNKEFVLSPHIAKQYLYSVNGETSIANQLTSTEVAPEVLTAEDKPVEEAKPVKTPEMEELENEIATLQSDIETYEIESENTQEEIDIEKGNLKDALADIDARIKEVRASKKSAAAKRDAIEELKAEKQDVKDDNKSLIDGYKEDIKNAKREAKKAANRIKRLSTKLEGIAPVAPVAEEKTYTMKDVSFEDDIKAIIKSGKPGKEVLNYTDTYKDDGQDHYVYKNPESRLDVTIRKTAPQSFAVDITVMSSDTFKTPYASYESGPVFGTRKRAEQAALEILRNPTLLYSGVGAVRTSLEPDLAKALIESRGIEPTKKVVGTLEVEEEEAVAAVSDIISKSKALAGQLNAGVITAEEYNTSIKELIDEYQNNIEIALEETPPIDTITADDSQSDIAAFEAQSPKLKFVKNLLNATKNFRGLFDAQDIPLKVHYFKSRKEMSKISAVLDGDESVAGGFMDAISNRIFIAEDALLEETAVHEFIHPIAKRIIRNNPELAARLEQEALAIPGIKEFIEQYEVDQQQEEAIVQSIAKAVLEALKKGRTIPQKIRDFFRKLLRVLGFNPEVVIGDSQSNLNDFIRNISEAFATGTPIKITKDLEQSELLAKVTTIKVKDSDIGNPINRIKVSDRKELTGVRYVNPKQFNNKKVLVTAYDNLKTGSVTWRNRVTGKTFTFSDKKGGPMHAYLKENKRNNIVAAYTKLEVALKFARQAKNAEFLLYSLMSTESSLQANKDIFQDFFGPVLEDISNEFGFETFKRDLKTILTTKEVQKFKSDLDEISTPAELATYVDNVIFDDRREIFKNVFPELKGTPSKSTIMQTKYGLPTSGELYVMYQEEAMNNAAEGDLFAASRIKPVVFVNEKEYNKISKQKISREEELFGVQIKLMPKESEHAAYPFAVEGETVGLFSDLINARDILPYVPKDAEVAYKFIEGGGSKLAETELEADAETRALEIEGTSEAIVTAAPIRVFPEFFARKFKGRTPTVKDIVAIKNSLMFKSYRKTFIDSARLFNLTVGNITTNIGIWEGALEYSNNLEVKGSNEDLKAFAAYMGLVAEPQEATIVSKVRKGAKSAAINIEYKSEALAQKAVDDIREEGIIGLSYNTDRKIITIFAQEGDQERFQSYHEKHKSSIKNVEYYQADVDWIEEEDFEGILRQYRSSRQNQGARRKDLRDAITEVLGESPDGPKGIGDVGVSRIKHTKSTRQNIIRPAEAIQEEFKKRLTPRRVGSTYYGKLGILTTVDINELGGLVNPNTGATIGLDLVKEYNKVMPELVKQVMPLPKQLEPALQLADKIREALDFTTHDKIVEYARILLASIDNPTEFESDQKAIDAIRNAFAEFDVQEFTETDLEFVTENISEIRGYASEVYLSGLKNTKFSDRMKGTKYEGKEALVKNDIVRSGTEILLQQRDELAAAGYKKISVEQLDLTDTHMEAIAEKLGGGEDFVKILKSNRKSITNMARNDLRNKNVVAGLVESSKRFFQRGIPRKYIQGDIYASEKVLDKILAIIKPKFSETEIKVLEDYMEYSEVRRLFQTIQSLQHGYLPPMAYGIIRKFEAAVNAIELAGKVGNMSIMVDANGRLIKERLAVREARKLTTPSEELTKSEMDALQKRTTTGAMPFFKRQVDKVIPILYNQISKAFSVIESQREIDIAKYNEKFAKVKPIARFEGTQYTNSDVNMLGHMYLIEKQYLSNPGSNKVPKLYESLILSITDESVNREENLRYIKLFEDFKLENNTLDIQKVERFLKFMGAMTGATKESGMGIVDFVSKRMRDSRDRVRHLQEFQNKTQVEVFDNYIYVATKPNANTGEVKATMIESLLNKDATNTLGFAKTSITRQTYRNEDGTLRKLKDNREPVFDLMFAANYATNEVLSAYHLGEEFRNMQAQLNILAKLGDAETQILASALKNDIRQRIINTFEYKMDRPTGTAEKFIQKMLSGTYTTYLASARRFIELFSNAALVSIANPTVARAMVVNYKENIGNATMNETKSIMDKIGSAHRERFNKTGKAFYSAEGIGAERIAGAKQTPSIWDKVKKKKSGEFREAYVAFKNAMNKLGEAQTGFKNFGDKIVRMSDTKIGAVAWNAIFKERFQEITGIEYSSAMLTDADLFIQNRLAMKEAGNYADVFLKESFAGGAFDMNQKALKNKGTMKYLQNMFRTFRTFYYESNRNAVRSLLDGRFGIEGGTMTKEEAARRLAGASAASIIYAVGTTHLMTLLWQQLFMSTGLADEEEEREWTTAAKQAVAEFVLLSSIGRAPAIGYGLVSGAVRGTIRYMDQEDLTALEAFNKFAQRLSGSNFLLRQTVPIIGEPAMLAKKTIESALDAAQGELEGEDAQELFLEILKTAVIYQGIPFSGDFMSAMYTLQRMNEEEKKPKKRKKPKFKSVID